MRPEVMEHIVEQLREVDGLLKERLEKRFASIGINRVGLSLQALLLGTFIVLLFEELRRKFPVINVRKVSWKFMRRVGDVASSRKKNYNNARALRDVLQALNETSMLDEGELWRLSATISIVSKSIMSMNDGNAESFARSLLKNLVESSEVKLRGDQLNRFKIFVNLERELSAEESVELIRSGIEALPLGSREMANRYLYYIVRVFGIWPNLRRHLEPPITRRMIRPLSEIGLPISIKSYKADIVKLGRSMFPEDPATISALDLIASVWCRKERKRCKECPLYFACPRLG